ncbi:terminase large subunit [Actinomadura sp. HBU206391]|uniref:terminase large subunit n=1 Tax=Actinomadura sp. HBU206391 TaxID=2731692 RepID=UPI00164FE725|nr:terminase large subunit [Actinomadura sp. HBU206391]MBC6458413.1 terminase [Actinomadura sp. HBU206391]
MTLLAEPPLLGAQQPRICVTPEALSSAGQEAFELAASAGLHLDPWQRMVLDVALGERADGKWAAFECALILARQNGKSAVFEARVLAGLFLFNEALILYSAHEFKTATEMFKRILALIEGNAQFRRRVKTVARSKGEEGIELLGGQRLRFVARSTGSGRGFSGDLNIWDESQHLSDASVDALMPTMLARPNAQLWYGGSAADKDLAPCGQITSVRNRALKGGASDLAFFEWSADLCTEECAEGCTEHDDRNDPKVWAKTNPGLGRRVSLEMIARLHTSMSVKGFNREILSVGNYPSRSGGWEVIPEAAWRKVEDEQSKALDPVFIAVDVTPDQAYASIAIAGVGADGLTHGELVDHRSATDWVVDRAIAIKKKQKAAGIALDPGGPAGSLVPEFKRRGVELITPTMREVGNAYGSLYGAIVRPKDAERGWSPRMRFRPHPTLTAAVQGATTRPLGDAKVWSRRDETVDISPLMAVTIAIWAHENRPPPRPKPVAGPSNRVETTDMFRPTGRLQI